MAWDIILKSFGVILLIMVIAQGLYWVLGGSTETHEGDEQ